MISNCIIRRRTNKFRPERENFVDHLILPIRSNCAVWNNPPVFGSFVQTMLIQCCAHLICLPRRCRCVLTLTVMKRMYSCFFCAPVGTSLPFSPLPIYFFLFSLFIFVLLRFFFLLSAFICYFFLSFLNVCQFLCYVYTFFFFI